MYLAEVPRGASLLLYARFGHYLGSIRMVPSGGTSFITGRDLTRGVWQGVMRCEKCPAGSYCEGT
eukprot:1777522-Rhodomonas_salina.3